jgi:hypothetical protein
MPIQPIFNQALYDGTDCMLVKLAVTDTGYSEL